MKYYLLVFSLLFSTLSYSQKIPILGFIGVPGSNATSENYSKMEKAGFTVSLINFKNTNEALNALAAAKKTKIKLILFFPELHSEPAINIPKIKNESALLGYFIGDEPRPSQFKDFQLYRSIIEKYDSTHLFYSNLNPNYAPLEYLEGLSYQEYVKQAVQQLNLSIISFDNYPIVNNKVRDNFYANLETIRAESVISQKPFWGFACSTIHFDYKKPTLAGLKLQQFGNLLYGAKGIQYFTYWTMTSDPNWKKDNYSYAIVDEKGNETPTYSLVKTVNEEIQRLSWVFADSKVVDVFHVGQIPEGAKKLKKFPDFFKEFSLDQDAVVSYLENRTKKIVVVQNKSLDNNLVLKYNNVKPIYSVNNTNGKYSLIKAGSKVINISPGDIKVFFVNK